MLNIQLVGGRRTSKSALVTRCTFLPSQHHPHEYVEHSLRTPPPLGGARCGALEGQKNGAVFILSRDSVSMYIVLGLCVYYTRIAVTYYKINALMLMAYFCLC